MKLLKILFCFCLLAPAAFALPEVGKPAPQIKASDIDGNTFDLATLKGEVVVLEWTNHECPFVRKFYGVGKMQELQKEYTTKGVKWVRVISSAEGKQGYVTADEAKEVVVDEGINASHTLLDPTALIGKAYGAKTTPHMFVINKEGNIAYQGAIDSIRIPDPTKIAEADNYVAMALDSLLKGEEVGISSTQPYGCSVKY